MDPDARKAPRRNALRQQGFGQRAFAERIELVKRVWPELRPKLEAQLIGPDELQRMLRDAQAPAHPSDIQLAWGRFKDTYVRAQMIRKRYTVLDLLLELNLLDELVEELFAPGGFWAEQE